MNALDLVSLENFAVSATFVAGLVAMAAFVLHLGTRREWLRWVGQLAMGVALVGSGGTLVARALIAQHAPWSNLWESMVTMLFATLAFYFLVEVLYKPRFFGVVASPLVMILIGGASILPPSFKGAAPLMPALQSYWIKVHVLLVLSSYAAFTMSFAASLAYLFFSWRARTAVASPALATAEGPVPSAGGSPVGGTFEEPLRFFDELSYRLILMGFPLLMFGIITGAMWANGAWGTYWSWDPKETWSLITWFVYAAYLHARLTHDWTGTKAAWLGVLGFASMIVTYIGVNYLSSGLHSYGFIR